MKHLGPVLGLSAAVLAVFAAVLTPFVLVPAFVKAIAALRLQPDPVYSGGEVVRTLERGAYRIAIHRPVTRQAPFQDLVPFVQVTWDPAAALPGRVSEELDLDGDGRPDLAVAFDVPADPQVALAADVRALGGLVKGSARIGKDSFSSLIARVGTKVVVRVPLAERPVARRGAVRGLGGD